MNQDKIKNRGRYILNGEGVSWDNMRLKRKPFPPRGVGRASQSLTCIENFKLTHYGVIVPIELTVKTFAVLFTFVAEPNHEVSSPPTLIVTAAD